MAKAWFDAVNISCTAKPTVAGRPWPPYSGSQVMAVQPPSRNMS